MTWILLDGCTVLASGSWREVVEAGEELGLIGRRYRDVDGFETAPVLYARGVMMVPEAMFPGIREDESYG